MPVYHCHFEPSAKGMIRSLRQREIACKKIDDMKPTRAVLQGHRHQSKPTHGLCSWTIRRGAGGESVGSSISHISSCNGGRCSCQMCEWCVMPRHSWLSIVFWQRMWLAWQRRAVERPWGISSQAGGHLLKSGISKLMLEQLQNIVKNCLSERTRLFRSEYSFSWFQVLPPSVWLNDLLSL